MSLKKLLIKNFITYKLYIYYNLYIRNKAYKKRNFYSQWGEDKYIQDFFKGKIKGFYVDIGCFHPIMYSNTCLLFNGGWSGINVDLNQTTIDLFNIMRPNDHNICAAISDKVVEKELFIDHPFSPVNTIQKSFYNASNKKVAFKNFERKKIITKIFEKVVENLSNLPKIDFLNIDCEGHDYSVLKGFDLQYYSPELICIETHNINHRETDTNKNIIDLLKGYNYTLIKRSGPSSFFNKY